jgi:hypothetical protein
MTKKITILLVLSLSSIFCYSQNRYDQFTGSINLGTGYSTLIDFNRNSKGYIVPFQFGVRTQKFIARENYLEFGILYSNKGIHWVKWIYLKNGTLIGEEHYDLSLRCFEISTRYFKKCQFIEKIDLNYYYGLNLAIMPIAPEIQLGKTIDIQASYFRKYCPTINSGYSLMIHKNLRIDLGLNFFLLPLLKKEFEDDFSSLVTYYKPMMFPAELILSLNVFIK